MRLYHGSLEIVENPKIIPPTRTLDYGAEWIDFVMSNRILKDFKHDYDLVYGPVANDRVYAAFALYENDLLDKEGLIKELKTYKLVDQMLFHTDKSLKYLRYIESKEITL